MLNSIIFAVYGFRSIGLRRRYLFGLQSLALLVRYSIQTVSF